MSSESTFCQEVPKYIPTTSHMWKRVLSRVPDKEMAKFSSCSGRIEGLTQFAAGLVMVVAMPILIVYVVYLAATRPGKGKLWKVLDSSLAVLSVPIVVTLIIFRGLACIVHPGAIHRQVEIIKDKNIK